MLAIKEADTVYQIATLKGLIRRELLDDFDELSNEWNMLLGRMSNNNSDEYWLPFIFGINK